jgi:ABC-type phosphate transport system substrate-binding protein
MLKWLVSGVTATLFFVTTASAEMVVIVHKSNPLTTVTADKLAKYYKKTIQLWDSGAKIDPVDLPDQHPLAVEFSDKILHLTIDVKHSMWTIRTLSGQGTPPRQLPTEAEVVSHVASKSGAIGYVDRARADDSVKIIEVTF